MKSLHRILLTLALLFVASLGLFAQAPIDSTVIVPNYDDPTFLSNHMGQLYAALVVLATFLGQRFAWFRSIPQKWFRSVAIGIVLALTFLSFGAASFVELLTQYFPWAGIVYNLLKLVGLDGWLSRKLGGRQAVAQPKVEVEYEE